MQLTALKPLPVLRRSARTRCRSSHRCRPRCLRYVPAYIPSHAISGAPIAPTRDAADIRYFSFRAVQCVRSHNALSPYLVRTNTVHCLRTGTAAVARRLFRAANPGRRMVTVSRIWFPAILRIRQASGCHLRSVVLERGAAAHCCMVAARHQRCSGVQRVRSAATRRLCRSTW